MQVKHFEELRTRLGRVDAQIHVIKNTFIERAIKGLGLPGLNGALTGQTAMGTCETEMCAAAKGLKTFVAEFERPPVRAGILPTPSSMPNQSGACRSPPRNFAGQTPRASPGPATKLVRVRRAGCKPCPYPQGKAEAGAQ
jgi:hypothetical protein